MSDVGLGLAATLLELVVHELLQLEDAPLRLDAPLVGQVGTDGRGGVVGPALDVVAPIPRQVQGARDHLDGHGCREPVWRSTRGSAMKPSITSSTIASMSGRSAAMARALKALATVLR